ncbi:hypothetical protein VE04_05335 [Pseudogymnoascus sp. 24MN13]|nr:hypothetical protein VE04_05335 [Pseudogymnoascus sp. 24MN13]
MCWFSQDFYSWCGHFYIHRAPCAIPICMFAGGAPIRFSIEYECPACMGHPVQPTPPPFPASSRFFAPHDALGEQPGTLRTPPNPLVHVVSVAELPENSAECAICGGPLSDCAFDPDAWDKSEFPVHLPCDHRHIFGVSCILRWLNDNSTCPVCRCEFNIDRETGGPWETSEERARRIAARPRSEVRIVDEELQFADWSDSSMPGGLDGEAQDGGVARVRDNIATERRRAIELEVDELIREESRNSSLTW